MCRHGNGERERIFNAVSKVGKIDSAGSWKNNAPRIPFRPKDAEGNLDYWYGRDEKVKWLRQYRFNMCGENSVEPGYVTEKIFECLEAGCIPIYYGPKDIEPTMINPNIIINCHGMTDKQITDRVRWVDQHYDEFTKQPMMLPNAYATLARYRDTFCGKVKALMK